MLKLSTTLKTATLLGVLFLSPLTGAAVAGLEPAPAPDSSVLFAEKAGHKHKWQKSSKKVWVAPLYQQKLVGTDAKGRPIYKDVMVREGYYKVVTVQKCVKCGQSK